MDVPAPREAASNVRGWWAVEQAQSSSQAGENTLISEEVFREYRALAAVAATMSCGIVLLNQRDHIAYFNASAVRLLDVRSDDLIAEPAFDIRRQLLARAADPELAREALETLWAQPERETTVDLALAGAALRWLRVSHFPMRDAQERSLGRGLLLDDITLEYSSAGARAEALALAARELKTPLAIIKGAATTLLSSSLRWDAAMQREMLQMIDTQSDRLYDILNTLLDVWRFDTGTNKLQLARSNIAELVVGLAERWRARAPRHTFTTHIQPDLAPIVCDAVRIEQALDALLDNAITYSPQGGQITLRVDTNDDELRISVADQGIGIAPEQLDRIFDRFYRVRQGNNEHVGSGLGLPVARSIFEAHGGKVWADSPGLGQGAIFSAVLPLAPQTPTPAPMQRDTAHQPTAQAAGALRSDDRASILIAESDARIARYLRANLEELRYRVQVVNQGAQFLRQLDLQAPALIILAGRVGDTNGIDLLQRVREFARTPVMLLADDCDDDERARLLDLGADDLVVKPFGLKELLARARVLLRRTAALEQAARDPLFSTGDLMIDYAQRQVWLRGHHVQLSRTEYKLLSVLAHNAGRVLTHEILLERVWGPEYQREVDFIWVYISRLRRKIEDDPRHPCYILTVPDVGYKLAKV